MNEDGPGTALSASAPMARRGQRVSAGQRLDMGDELGWLGDGELRIEHAEVYGEDLQAVGSGVEDARAFIDGLDGSDPGSDPLGDHRRRGVDRDPRLEPPRVRGDAPRHERDDVLV